MHLRAINERVEGLSFLANSFCQNIKGIVIDVMQRTIHEVVGELEARDNTHTAVAKTIRNVSILVIISMHYFVALKVLTALFCCRRRHSANFRHLY